MLIKNLSFGSSGVAVQSGITNVLELTALTNATEVEAGTPALIYGKVISSAPVAGITINGIQADAVDAGQDFYSTVLVLPGVNIYEIIATDTKDNTATVVLSIEGVQSDPGQIDYQVLADASASIVGEYGQTSFDEQPEHLFADVAVKNNGLYALDAPLLVGVKNIREQSTEEGVFRPVPVHPRNVDGVTPDGIPYYDVTGLLAHGTPEDDDTLSPGESTEVGTISFDNPNRQQFAYDLVVLGRLNSPPPATSGRTRSRSRSRTSGAASTSSTICLP